MKLRLITIVLALLAPLAMAGKNDDTLNVAFERTMLTLDTYATAERLSLVIAHNVGDTLIYRNPTTGEFEPHLATAWRAVDDVTFEFDLRQGVKFHNGDDFTSADVVATLEFVIGDGAGLAGTGTLQWIESITAIDDYKVQIKAKALTPTAYETISLIGVIYPASVLNSQGPEYIGQNPIGTGPYRFVSQADNTIRFERFEDYFGGAKGQPAIRHLVIHTLPEESSRIASLMTGAIDIARSGSISPDQAPAIQGRARVEAADILRTWFIQMDSLGRSGSDFFTDQRVRQAVAHAINKDEIVDILLSGYGRVIQAPCNPVQFGCDEAFANTYDYNPERARELLAEAGYPNGFTVDIFGYREQQVAQAIQGYLEEVGIRTELQWYGGQYDVVSQRLAAGEIALYFGSWGSSSIYDASAVMDIHFKTGEEFSLNASNTIDAALSGALQTVDLDARRELYAAAIGEITGEVYMVPLFAGRVLAGVSNDLDWAPSSDEIERYFLAKWR